MLEFTDWTLCTSLNNVLCLSDRKPAGPQTQSEGRDEENILCTSRHFGSKCTEIAEGNFLSATEYVYCSKERQYMYSVS